MKRFTFFISVFVLFILSFSSVSAQTTVEGTGKEFWQIIDANKAYYLEQSDKKIKFNDNFGMMLNIPKSHSWHPTEDFTLSFSTNDYSYGMRVILFNKYSYSIFSDIWKKQGEVHDGNFMTGKKLAKFSVSISTPTTHDVKIEKKGKVVKIYFNDQLANEITISHANLSIDNSFMAIYCINKVQRLTLSNFKLSFTTLSDTERKARMKQ